MTNDVGYRIHDMLRRDVLRWSIGFIPDSSLLDRDGKTRVITTVKELLELSVVPLPANERTMTVGLKELEKHEVPSIEGLRERCGEIGLPTDLDVRMSPGERDRLDRIRVEARDEMLNLLDATPDRKSESVGGEEKALHAMPVRIGTFEIS